MGPHTSCNDCCIVLCVGRIRMVGGGGGGGGCSSCMFSLHPVQTSTDAGLTFAPCALTFAPCTCGVSLRNLH